MEGNGKRQWDDSFADGSQEHSPKHPRYDSEVIDEFSFDFSGDEDCPSDSGVIDLRNLGPSFTPISGVVGAQETTPTTHQPMDLRPPISGSEGAQQITPTTYRPIETANPIPNLFPPSGKATVTRKLPGFISVMAMISQNPTVSLDTLPPDSTIDNILAGTNPLVQNNQSALTTSPFFLSGSNIPPIPHLTDPSDIQLYDFMFDGQSLPPIIDNFAQTAIPNDESNLTNEVLDGSGTADQPVILSSSPAPIASTPEPHTLPTPLEPLASIEIKDGPAGEDEDDKETENIRKRALEAQLAKMEFAKQPHQVKTKMLPHQLQALAWMKDRENPKLPSPGSRTSVQFWKARSQGRYFHIVSKELTEASKPPVLYSGGVLADDMGLGKTLQMISLVVSDDKPGPTLIVCPLSVMSNWQQQFKQHLRNDSPNRVLIFHSRGARVRESDLKQYNVVITTYNKLAMEYESTKKVLTNIDWRRVILDEGHIIRNANTKSAKSACTLKALSKWVVTGTPIINRVDDLRSIAKFVGIHQSLEKKDAFLTMMKKPKLCQSFVADLCLRRTKDMKFVNLKLPPKTEKVELINFTEDERVAYDILLSDARKAAQRFFRSHKPALWSTVLERLLRLRQYCDHWTLSAGKPEDPDELLSEIGSPSRSGSPASFLKDIVKARELCHVCWDSLSPSNEPVLTPCKHGFCKPCLAQASHDGRICCPRCKSSFDENELVITTFGMDEVDALSSTGVDGFDEDAVMDKQSSKTIALFRILHSTLEDPKSKIVIFSQWTSFLNIVQAQLAELGITTTRLDGTMSSDDRDDSIKAIQTDPGTRVMLASLRTASVGITLTSANVVILADSWWAPAIEEQAIDRIHRLGQTRPTTVYRLVMKNTVEEGVVAIQDSKRRLFGEAFQESFKILTAGDTQDMLRFPPSSGSSQAGERDRMKIDDIMTQAADAIVGGLGMETETPPAETWTAKEGQLGESAMEPTSQQQATETGTEAQQALIQTGSETRQTESVPGLKPKAQQTDTDTQQGDRTTDEKLDGLVESIGNAMEAVEGGERNDAGGEDTKQSATDKVQGEGS